MVEHRVRPLAQALLDRTPPLLPDVEVHLASLARGRSPESVFLHRLVRSVLEQRRTPGGGSGASARVRGADLKHLAALLRRPVLDLVDDLVAEGLLTVSPHETEHRASPEPGPGGLVPSPRTVADVPAEAPRPRPAG